MVLNTGGINMKKFMGVFLTAIMLSSAIPCLAIQNNIDVNNLPTKPID